MPPTRYPCTSFPSRALPTNLSSRKSSPTHHDVNAHSLPRHSLLVRNMPYAPPCVLWISLSVAISTARHATIALRRRHSPHAPPFLELPKPAPRARPHANEGPEVPAGRTRTLYSIPRRQPGTHPHSLPCPIRPFVRPLAPSKSAPSLWQSPRRAGSSHAHAHAIAARLGRHTTFPARA
ncbi:hypothetical protein C8Q77DRAFT_312561 [Trametes polyzona]|nr:hypothetical protein C8Q77DRAFT_312561 [Trametes polyzona]